MYSFIYVYCVCELVYVCLYVIYDCMRIITCMRIRVVCDLE
jgi:hypothetical protein